MGDFGERLCTRKTKGEFAPCIISGRTRPLYTILVLRLITFLSLYNRRASWRHRSSVVLHMPPEIGSNSSNSVAISFIRLSIPVGRLRNMERRSCSYYIITWIPTLRYGHESSVCRQEINFLKSRLGGHNGIVLFGITCSYPGFLGCTVGGNTLSVRIMNQMASSK